MAYEWAPAIGVAIILIIIGNKMDKSGMFGFAKLGLIIIGILVLIWGIFAGWADLNTVFVK